MTSRPKRPTGVQLEALRTRAAYLRRRIADQRAVKWEYTANDEAERDALVAVLAYLDPDGDE